MHIPQRFSTSFFHRAIFVLVVVIQFNAYAQKGNDYLPTEKSVGHSIEITPFGLGYSITDWINENTAFGFGLEAGASFKYYLNNPDYLKYSVNADSIAEEVYETVKLKPAVKWRYDFVQFKFFIQRDFSWNGQLNTGLSFGVGNMGGEHIKPHFTASVLCEFYYGWEHFKIGSRLQPGITQITYNADRKTTFFSLLLTPVVLKICF